MQAETGGGLRGLGLGNSALRQQRRRRPRRGVGTPPASRSGPTAVQRLFDACREVFSVAGTVPPPPPAGVERIKSVLDTITAADVDLTPNMSYFQRTHGNPRITYLHLYKCEVFSIGIFCLPSRGIIPLHSHPGMTVFSKLLFGAMHVMSYDWATTPHQDNVQLQAGSRLAKVKADAILIAPCETSVLYPEDGGNIHCFTAQNACAVLDVLCPPYDSGSGRHCQHYRASSSSVGESAVSMHGGDRYAFLEECEQPQDFCLVGSTYMGPRILDH